MNMTVSRIIRIKSVRPTKIVLIISFIGKYYLIVSVLAIPESEGILADKLRRKLCRICSYLMI